MLVRILLLCVLMASRGLSSANGNISNLDGHDSNGPQLVDSGSSMFPASNLSDVRQSPSPIAFNEFPNSNRSQKSSQNVSRKNSSQKDNMLPGNADEGDKRRSDDGTQDFSPATAQSDARSPYRYGGQGEKKKKPDRRRPAFWSEPVQVGCRELRARRYITDGFCTSEKPIKEVVCAGNCLPIMDLPWYAEFVKTLARSKLREWQCVEDVVRKKRVRLLCQNGELRYYRIKVVKSCKCKKMIRKHNRTNFGSKKKRRRRKNKNKKRKGRKNKRGRVS